jgi:hypothetical protein
MISWSNASNGKIPSNAIPFGRDTNGDPLYVARASIQGGGVQLGKIRVGFGAAYIPYGGSEISCPNYQVMVGEASFPTAFAPYGPKGPAAAPNWSALVSEVCPPDQHAEHGFVPPVFGNVANNQISAALSQYFVAAQGTPAAPVFEFSAIACGCEQDGTPLFCALVAYKGSIQPGKVRLGLGGANISYGGAEIAGITPYSILCDASYGFLPTHATDSGYVPEGSTPMGTDDDGTPLYFARTLSTEGVQIGKVSPNYDGRIGYAGVEQQVNKGSYQVMIAAPNTGSITPNANNGNVPDGAIVLGCEPDGTPLFGALTGPFEGGSGPWPSSATQLGKVRLGFGGARIPYKGTEVLATDYSVLCATGYQTRGWPT